MPKGFPQYTWLQLQEAAAKVATELSLTIQEGRHLLEGGLRQQELELVHLMHGPSSWPYDWGVHLIEKHQQIDWERSEVCWTRPFRGHLLKTRVPEIRIEAGDLQDWISRNRSGPPRRPGPISLVPKMQKALAALYAENRDFISKKDAYAAVLKKCGVGSKVIRGWGYGTFAKKAYFDPDQ